MTDTPLQIDLDKLDNPERLRIVSEMLPDPEIDAALQKIVSDAAELADFPVALVSLVVQRIQFFRAFVGLPESLVVARATDRCVSFCQFVVSSGRPLVISEARSAPGLPQELVEAYGIQSYVGMPLRVHDQIVGTLCVMDVASRVLDDEQLSGLRMLADLAEVRLTAIVSETVRTRRHLYRAVQPAFGELRNIFQVLYWDLENTRIAAAELERLRALVQAAEEGRLDAATLQMASGVLRRSRSALDDIYELVAGLQDASDRASKMFEAIESSLEENARAFVGVAQAVNAASGLAEHHTRSQGGVEWGPLPTVAQLQARPGELIAVLSLALRGMADRLTAPGIRGAVSEVDGRVIISLRAEVSDADLSTLLGELLMVQADGLEVTAESGVLHIMGASFEP